MRDAIHSTLNQLSLAWRNFAAIQGPSFFEHAEDKSGLFGDDPAVAARAGELTIRYDLQDLRERATCLRWKETMAFLECLEAFQSLDPDWMRCQGTQGRSEAETGDGTDELFRWLDVGSRNWTYVEALCRFIRKHCPAGAFQLDGLEIDPNRRFANLRLRRQEAEFYAQSLAEAKYHGGDILAWQQPADVISHFLPFVFTDPHLAWGLPMEIFRPERILVHQFQLLKPGGALLIVNQDADEAGEQERLLQNLAEQAPLKYQSAGRLPDSFMKYRYPRYGWLCRKEG